MTELLAVVAITLLAVISPGPDFAMVTRNSLLLSRRAGVCTAIGIGLGVLIHVGYTLVGVGLLIQRSVWLFNAMKIAGAVYLVWLGVKMLRSQPVDRPVQVTVGAGGLDSVQIPPAATSATISASSTSLVPVTSMSATIQPAGWKAEWHEGWAADGAALRRGFLTNALNPKTSIFIVSLFMQVVHPNTPLAVRIAYGAFISVTHIGWFSLVALCFSSMAVRARLLAARHWIDRAFGSLLVGFGVLLAFASVSR